MPETTDWRELLRRVLLIRRVEERVAEMVGVDFRGFTHFAIGQEVTAVAACAALRPDDWVFTTHRNRAHVLARGADPGSVLAEVLGKDAGTCRGRGGSFHVAAPSLHIPVASAIVAGNLPVAAGAALGARLEGRGRVALAFFGDGATNEGAFHETVNLAALWRLPLLLVCENNDAVPYDPARSGLAAPDIPAYVRGYGVPAEAVDGGDAEAVLATVSRAAAHAREGGGPTFIEARTHRGPLGQAVRPGLPCGPTDLAEAWQPSADHPLPAWRDADPLLRLARGLVERGVLERADLEALDAACQEEARAAQAFARGAPFPALESALEGVYA